MSSTISDDQVARRAIVYIRQSTLAHVATNLESQRRQYALVERARELGFRDIDVIDDDLGRSGSGLAERPGFQRLVAHVCAGEVGAVFCIEASRLARNGRDWHHLVDFCGLVGAAIVDPEGIYDPRVANDRLLLGLKGTMSEFELSLFRQRSFEALREKARRGELQFCLPVGLCWTEDGRIELDPDRRIQESIGLVFRKFRHSGTAVFVKRGIDFTADEASVPGGFIAAISTSVGGARTKVVSVHVGPPHYRKHLDALRAWLVDCVLPSGPFVFGGDLNSSRTIAKWHAKYLTELSTVGLHDCHWSLHLREAQSFWGRQTKAAYQDDHLFTSMGLASSVLDCQVRDTAEIRTLSDHGPLTLDLKLPSS